MITKQQMITSHMNQVFQHVSLKNSDGTPVRARKTGQVKTWKTRPDEFKMPVKYGLRQSFYITHENTDEWELV